MPITASIFCVFTEIINTCYQPNILQVQLVWKKRAFSSNFKGVNVNVITYPHAMCASAILKTIRKPIRGVYGKKMRFYGRHHLLRVKHNFKQRKIADQKICMWKCTLKPKPWCMGHDVLSQSNQSDSHKLGTRSVCRHSHAFARIDWSLPMRCVFAPFLSQSHCAQRLSTYKMSSGSSNNKPIRYKCGDVSSC